MIPEVLNWVGSHWGRQYDAIVCEQCAWEDPTDTYEADTCPVCGSPDSLRAAVSNGLLLELRYLMWKYDQAWLPQRFYLTSDDGSERYWRWLGRRWLVREWEGLW